MVVLADRDRLRAERGNKAPTVFDVALDEVMGDLFESPVAAGLVS